VRIIKNDILEETQELIKIFVTSIKTAEKNINIHSKFDIGFLKQMKLICGAERHHYSMFNVGRSMFDVHNPYGKNATCDCLQNNFTLIGRSLYLVP